MKKNSLQYYYHKACNLRVTMIMLATIGVAVLMSCEDPLPDTYIPENYIQACLIVDEPIQNIVIQRTQPISDTFLLNNSLIRDARVRLFYDNTMLELAFRDTGKIGYYYPDQSVLVKSGTTYNLEILFKDSTLITGKTQTPQRSQWAKRAPKILQYPIDSTNPRPPDSLFIKWDSIPGYFNYLISIRNLDTLNYGKYLPNPSNEKNRRIYRPQFRRQTLL